ncbi:hypothetical protein [Comamonas testosteroni]|uniref:hypothetical protein n=1 Tax=Comamonas testosteroni TaxID=285 RepID=UPI00391DF3C0
MLKTLGLGMSALVIAGLSGCAVTGSDFVEYAERASGCTSSVGFYGTAIGVEKREGRFDSSTMDKAIAGIKTTALGCNADIIATMSNLGSAVSDLREKRPKDALDIALLSLHVADENRDHLFQMYYASAYLSLAASNQDEALWNRVMTLYLDRGYWDPRLPLGSSSLEPYATPDIRQRIDTLQVATAKAAEAAKSATGIDCSSLHYCQPSQGGRSFVEADYYDAYAETLRQVGEPRRASLVEGLAKDTRQKRTNLVAKLQAESTASASSTKRATSSSSIQTSTLSALVQATGQIAQAARGSGSSVRSQSSTGASAPASRSASQVGSGAAAIASNSFNARSNAASAPNSYTSNSQPSAADGKGYRDGQQCTKLSNNSDSFQNLCAFPVWVSFVNQNGQGAAGPIKPGGREVITKSTRIQWAACEYPSSPKLNPSLSSAPWHGSPSSRYYCVGR